MWAGRRGNERTGRSISILTLRPGTSREARNRDIAIGEGVWCVRDCRVRACERCEHVDLETNGEVGVAQSNRCLTKMQQT